MSSPTNKLRPGQSPEGLSFETNEYGTIVFGSVEDEERAYDEMLSLVFEQARYVLDNLEHMKEFQVSWLNYGSKDYCRRHQRNYAQSYPHRYCHTPKKK